MPRVRIDAALAALDSLEAFLDRAARAGAIDLGRFASLTDWLALCFRPVGEGEGRYISNHALAQISFTIQQLTITVESGDWGVRWPIVNARRALSAFQ